MNEDVTIKKQEEIEIKRKQRQTAKIIFNEPFLRILDKTNKELFEEDTKENTQKNSEIQNKIKDGIQELLYGLDMESYDFRVLIMVFAQLLSAAVITEWGSLKNSGKINSPLNLEVIKMKRDEKEVAEMIKMNESMLKKWHESVGKLTGVKDEGYAITLEFTAVWQVQVPRMSNDVVKNLNGLIGKRIGVLRTDIPGKEVVMREINTETEGGETYE